LLKLFRFLQFADSLRVLLKSIQSCLPVLFWSSMVLFMVLAVFGELFHILLMQFFVDEHRPVKARRQVFLAFGTFNRYIFTMYELTLANWIPVCHLLVNNVSTTAGYVALVFKIVVGFAIVRVVVGVFMFETFQTAATDDELMIHQTSKIQHQHALKMARFMREADENGDGSLDASEFLEYLRSDGVRTWLSAQGLNEEDDELLFDLLDDGDGSLSPSEVSRGISRLKGPAKSMDVICLMHMTSLLQEKFATMETMFQTKFEQIMSNMLNLEANQHSAMAATLSAPLLAQGKFIRRLA